MHQNTGHTGGRELWGGGSLYWLLTSDTFEEVVVGATNMGDDSDTTAAIAGGLKGIEVGFNEIPEKYINKLVDRELLTQISNALYDIRDNK
ncbi:ADP-ribosylglycohydrolase family protein [Bacillus sp. JJ634]